MAKLALLGGRPIRHQAYPPYVTTGKEEAKAVQEVLASGILSQFLGTWSPDFYGGPRVQGLEKAWSRKFGVRHSVSMNSATSGLYAALGAAGVGPGDEVIVSPYTMTASVTGALVYGAAPVFADIDNETYCLDPGSIRKQITERTRAIVAVDLFGHPAPMKEIMEIAEERDLTVIEDAAQAPGAKDGNRYAGTLAHMGVFSLNYHKTIHTGEGGIVVTDDDVLAERLQLIRNHGEVVVEAKGTQGADDLLGFNYRMTEIEAAIGAEQLRKLEGLLAARTKAARRLGKALEGLDGLALPTVRPGVRHGYYLYAMQYDAKTTGLARDRFVEAVRAEGVPLSAGYVRPIYLQPLYQTRKHWALKPRRGQRLGYDRGICPVTERMHFEDLVFTNACHGSASMQDIDDVAAAIRKVLDHAPELRSA